MKRLIFILGLMPMFACDSSDFTDEEFALLADMTVAPLPPSPTNAYADNAAAAILGQKFFFDTRFAGPLGPENSADREDALGLAGQLNLVSCASCHDPQRGGTDHRTRGGTSFAAGFTGRNTPTVLNAAYSPWMFWDGRKDSVWSQALGPIESPVEHNSSRLHVVHLINDHYRGEFEAVFGPLPDLADRSRFPRDDAHPELTRPGGALYDGMSAEDQIAVTRVYAGFGKAIEAYERRLNTQSSPFDRYMDGDTTAMNQEAIRGAKLFVGRASCNECHRGAMLADGKFHNHAIPQVGDRVAKIDDGRGSGIAMVLADELNGAGQFSDDPEYGALRLSALTVTEVDVGAFKTPPLRNVAETGPYMHTGAFETLWDVVEWYAQAAGTDGFVGIRDPAVRPLRLDDQDMNDLVAFLEALTCEPLPAALVTSPELP